MTAWLWALVGIGTYVVLSLLAGLGFVATVRRLGRAGKVAAAAESTTAPLTRERRWLADPARELVGGARRVPRSVDSAPRTAFVDALQRGDVMAANAASKEMGGLDLGDALAFCVVLAEREPTCYRVAAPRWFSRFVDESGDVSIEEAQLVQTALAALPSAPRLARRVLRELVRPRHLVTVPDVFQDFVAA